MLSKKRLFYAGPSAGGLARRDVTVAFAGSAGSVEAGGVPRVATKSGRGLAGTGRPCSAPAPVLPHCRPDRSEEAGAGMSHRRWLVLAALLAAQLGPTLSQSG